MEDNISSIPILLIISDEMHRIPTWFVLLLALAPFSLAQSTYATTTTPAADLSKIWYSVDFPWEAIALMAVTISFSFAALTFMFGKMFQSSDLEKLAKSEFIYAISTVVLLAFLIIFIDVLASKSAEFVGIISKDRIALQTVLANDKSPFVVADYYINRTLVCAQKRYEDGFCLVAIPMVLNSIEATKTTSGLSASSSLGSLSSSLSSSSFTTQISKMGLNVPISGINRLLSDLSYIIYMFFFQKNLLSLIHSTMLTVFLPAGVVLRGFPVVRSVGNLMIAVAVGLYFVYPISYSMLMVLGTTSGGVDGLCDITGVEGRTLLTSIPCPILTDIVSAGIFSKTADFFTSFVGQAEYQSTSIISYLDNTNKIIGEIVIFGVAYPFIAAVLTYSFIKSFSIFLNVDAQDFAEGLAKLV